MAKKEILVLSLIILLAFGLRLVALGQYPAGFTADEAAQGYTAYSILKTGKDEWGVNFPLNPRSFGDYKLPLQTYLMIPSIAIFGLNEWAVRLPNAILGSLGVLGIYLLVKELFANSVHPKGVHSDTLRVSLGLFSSFLLAISPWHISLSRGAFEANLTTFFLPMGMYWFLRGLRESKYLPLGSIFFGFNLFSYHAARLVTPLLGVVLVVWGRERMIRVIGKRRGRREIILGGVIFGLFLVLAFYSTLIGGGTRAADIGIFSAGLKAPKIFIDNYLSYLSPQFFFTQGAGEATYGMIPGRGVLYLFELPFLVFAFMSLAKKWDKRFSPILAWILLAPIPAALSLGVGYHANRVAVMMPAIQTLSAYGGILLWERVKEGLEGRISHIVQLLYCLIVILSFLAFLKTYFFIAPKITAPVVAYGWKETMAYLAGIEDDYQKIIVSRKFSEPQAFVAFYKKWEPEDFQKQTKDWLRYEKESLKFVDQLGKYNLGKYEFRNIDFSKDKDLRKTLLVGKPEEFPADTSVQKMIVYPDGERAFWIVETKEDKR